MAGHWPQLCEVCTRQGPGLDWAGGQGRAPESEGEAGLGVVGSRGKHPKDSGSLPGHAGQLPGFGEMRRSVPVLLSLPEWSRPPAPIHQGLDPLGTGTDTEKTHRLLHLFHKAAVLDGGRPEKQKYLVGMGCAWPRGRTSELKASRDPPLPGRGWGPFPRIRENKEGQGRVSHPSPSSQGSGWPCPTSSPRRPPRPQAGARKPLQKLLPPRPPLRSTHSLGRLSAQAPRGRPAPPSTDPCFAPKPPFPSEHWGHRDLLPSPWHLLGTCASSPPDSSTTAAHPAPPGHWPPVLFSSSGPGLRSHLKTRSEGHLGGHSQLSL